MDKKGSKEAAAAPPKPEAPAALVVRHSTRHVDGKFVSDAKHPATRHIK